MNGFGEELEILSLEQITKQWDRIC